MIHVLIFLRRKSSWTENDFFNYWRDEHASRMSMFPEILHYVQCQRITMLKNKANPAQENGSFDGVDELWVENEEAWRELQSKPDFFKNVLANRNYFTENDCAITLVTKDHTLIKTPSTGEGESMIKLMYGIKRKTGMSLKDFRDYYKNKHTRYSNELPGQQAYVQCHVVDPITGEKESPFDGVSQIWLKDVDALETLQLSPELQKGVEDCSHFLNMNQFFSFIGQGSTSDLKMNSFPLERPRSNY